MLVLGREGGKVGVRRRVGSGKLRGVSVGDAELDGWEFGRCFLQCPLGRCLTRARYPPRRLHSTAKKNTIRKKSLASSNIEYSQQPTYSTHWYQKVLACNEIYIYTTRTIQGGEISRLFLCVTVPIPDPPPLSKDTALSKLLKIIHNISGHSRKEGSFFSSSKTARRRFRHAPSSSDFPLGFLPFQLFTGVQAVQVPQILAKCCLLSTLIALVAAQEFGLKISD